MATGSLGGSLALPTGPRGRALAVAICVVIAALLWLGIVGPLITWHADRAEQLAERAALAGRMQGIADALPALRRQAAAAPHGNADAGQTVLEGTDDAIAGADLQERVQQMAAAAGVTLASVEMLPAEPLGAYHRIGIRLTVSGGRWAPLVQLLQSVEEGTPRMLVDDVQVHGRAMRDRSIETLVDASVSVFAFRIAAPAAARTHG